MACSTKHLTLIDSSDKKSSFLKIKDTQLATPIIKIDSILFYKSATVQMMFELEGGSVMYAIDNDSFKKYHDELVINQSATLTVKAIKSGYKDSNEISIQLYKLTDKTKDASIKLNPLPDKTYSGRTAKSLIDNEKGNLNFKEGNKWTGFQSAQIEVNLKLSVPTSVRKITCSLLKDHNSWIFLPKKIDVNSGDEQLGSKEIKMPESNENATCTFIEIEVDEIILKEITIIIQNQTSIPSWHPGAESTPWLFIDEILID